MRLICPSCGAQYEVPPEAIPPAGRDVQCSACQHVWFEKGPPPQLLNPQPWEEVPRVEDDDEEADDLADLRSAPLPQAAPRPRVDPEVSRILREEADREAQARAEEVARRALPESPPEPSGPGPAPKPPAEDDPVARAVADLAREDAAQRAAAPVAVAVPASEAKPSSPPRPARIEEPPAPPPAKPPALPSRSARTVSREVDIDQINSTLRSQADRIGAKAPQIEGARRRGGFGWGFTGTLLVLAVLAALYVFRPEIVEAVPQAAVLLDPYTQAVDAGRLWLDRQIANLLGAGTADAPAE